MKKKKITKKEFYKRLSNFIKCIYNIFVFGYIINLLNNGYFNIIDTLVLLTIATVAIYNYINILEK